MDPDDSWKESILANISGKIMAADKNIAYCIDAIKDYACSGIGCRGGSHGDFFWDEEAFSIKKVMTSFAAAFKATLSEIGAWLVWVANALHNFIDRELYRADKEVRDVADGCYDWRFLKVENGNGGRSR